MTDYIEREAARTLIKIFGKGAISDGKKTLDPVDDVVLLASGIDLIPAAEVVPRPAYDELLWERDLAIQQLRENFGVGLGEIKKDVVPVVRGQWKLPRKGDWNSTFICSVCGRRETSESEADDDVYSDQRRQEHR